MQKDVFISHRSTDKNFADIIFSFLARSGIHTDAIFCSSLPGNDVQQQISLEIKEALISSRCNIIILSKKYYNSIYCQNELGIIWFLDIPRIVIGLPDITKNDMVGFLDSQNLINRLDNRCDIERICGRLKSALPGFTESFARTSENIDKVMKEYKSELPLTDPIDESIKAIIEAVYSDPPDIII